MTALVVGLAVAVLLLSVLVAGLLRSHAEILRALHELGAGLELDRAGAPGGPGPVPVAVEGVPRPRTGPAREVPPALTGTTLDDEVVALPLDQDPVLLAFLSSGCTGCSAFWQALAAGGAAALPGARVVVVTRDADEESPSGLRDRAPGDVPVVLSSAAWDAFEVPGSPYAVLVEGGRVVGEGSGASWPQVVDLLSQARRDAPRVRS